MSARDDFVRDRAAFIEEGARTEDEGEDELSRLAREAYLAVLPEVPISRSPLTGELVTIPFDDVDLDGFWWDALDPVRASPNGGLPDGVISFLGAIDLQPPFASMPFLAAPGPGRPFVHPELLELDEVVAVISTVPVGRHTGWPILYFADAVPDDAELQNWWGARHYEYSCGGERHRGDYPPYEGDWDYELGPWLESGTLQWIAPGDAGFVLRRGADDCPYLGLEGDRAMARLQDGKLWRSDPGTF